MKNLGDTDLKRLHRHWRRRTAGRLAVLLDSVQTPFNVGAIVRTAAAERVEHLYVAGASAFPDHPRSRKISLGTERSVPWTGYETAAEAVAAVRDAGLFLLGIELADGAVPLHEVALPDDVCLALGHEDRGLSARTLEACDAVAFVPQLGRGGSLNVASAAAIAMYEVRRREWSCSPANEAPESGTDHAEPRAHEGQSPRRLPGANGAEDGRRGE
ncbi:MAG: TrmH family RNA methyltransferase [Actinobacteria bacterium]|nr:TrmH family RNA methyltransferase [Actinomycetota bacterium]